MKVEGEVGEEIQMPSKFRHKLHSHCEEMSRHFNDKWLFKVLSQCQQELLVDSSHRRLPSLVLELEGRLYSLLWTMLLPK